MNRQDTHMRPLLWMLLILLAAAALRLYQIDEIPPGLTHDEADHGLTAWQIVNGKRAVYFTIGYGREPLYDYAAAALMALIGPTYLAGRLTAVFFSLILIAAVYAWTRRAFDRTTALLAAAALALSFWPLMSGRQALRSAALPPLFTLAALAFWRGLDRPAAAGPAFLAAGLLLGLTFYTYIPARALWLAFPALAVYLWLRRRPNRRRAAWGTALTLGVAGLTAVPLFHYLLTHPGAEGRIRELSAPLAAARSGNVGPLLENVGGGLRLFFLSGDPTWRYNLPERPFLAPLLGVLFLIGVGLAFWWAARPPRPDRGAAACFSLIWLLAGMAPVLVTGPELSGTQAIGAQPAVYLFPALALAAAGRRLRRWERFPAGGGRYLWLIPLLLFTGTAAATARAYFGEWANAPQVRVQYESTTAAMLAYLERENPPYPAISTITPAPEHSPALALLLPGGEAPIRWFDGRSSLLLPDAPAATVLFPGFAPLAPELERYWETAVLRETLPLRPTDLDRPVRVYRVDVQAAGAEWAAAFTSPAAWETPPQVGDALRLLGYDLQTPSPAGAVRPGDDLRVVTWWQAQRPLPGVQLFTHLWAGEGEPAAQAVQLGAPGAGWRSGDHLLQLHQFTIPPDATAGEYQLLVGAFDAAGGRRYPVFRNGQMSGDTITLQPLTITP